MEDYWKQALQSFPDEYFVSQDETYTTLSVWHRVNKEPLRCESASINRGELCQWADPVSFLNGNQASPIALQCLVVPTHEFNDYPVDISRDDLHTVTHSLGISSSIVPLIFAPYTGTVVLDRQMSWYYGSPGLRVVASVDTQHNFTRAIIFVNKSFKAALEDRVHQFSSLAGHPLMLALAVRAVTLRALEEFFREQIWRLRQNEDETGFHTHYTLDSDTSSSTRLDAPQPFDLGMLSKKVGSDAANLGNLKIILARLDSIKDILYSGSHLKWGTFFGVQSLQQYQQLSEELLDIDVIFESMRQGLLEGMSEYQARTRNLQSVIFNLIAQDDANASIELAKESRAIAVATRNDGTSMKTIAIMTMVFLPATFYAALFAMPLLQWQSSPVVQTNFWVYWAFTVPSTLLVLLTWYWTVGKQVENDKVTGGAHGTKKRSRKNTPILHAARDFFHRTKAKSPSP